MAEAARRAKGDGQFIAKIAHHDRPNQRVGFDPTAAAPRNSATRAWTISSALLKWRPRPSNRRLIRFSSASVALNTRRADEVNRVVPRLIRYEKQSRPALGISIAPDQLTRAKGIDGVLIMDVVPGGPAEKAKLRSTRRNDDGDLILGDIIVAVGDHKIHTLDDLHSALENATVGQTVTVTVLRDGAQQKIDVTLGASTR